ncbi:serine hydrolase domain-containing protein [Sphingomonas lycopersici]|uniref:Beta-lactamase family protein n=1 Tax=Sphingomonas lycopersici TaxID=2951807 RepID=A0AA41Z892_9SPHN|nr:serine hydrolase [Sphingomonas lycopersici]MCW6534728.1 beta-lactamase family protein [Sphingomonas lycopersici]
MIRQLPLIGLALLLAAPAHAAEIAGPGDLGTAASAQVACAGIFVAGRAEAAVLRDDIHALAPFTQKVTLSVNRKARTVAASAPDGATRTALYRPAVGCTLLSDTVSREALERQVTALPPAKPRPAMPWPQGDTTPAPKMSEALAKAVDAAFVEQNKQGYPDTRAIVVVQHGRIVAEQYAPGFGRDTPFHGWSASKSIAGTLVGLLVDDGTLELDAPAPVPEWQHDGDPRKAITLRQLLNMSSGLRFAEPYQPGSDSIRMLFASADMGAVAAALPLDHAPGSAWSYSSGTTNILSGIVTRAVGGSLDAVTRFARKRLFEPAGMASALIEPDEAGVPIGSSYAYATARDWARFGLLYLDKGKVGKRQILSPRWVDFVRTPAPAAPRPVYSAQFWLNQGDDSGDRRRLFRDLPPDTFMAMGHNEQMVAIIPSLDTVIVRLGWTPEGQRFDHNKYLSGIVAALPSTGHRR